MFAHRTVAVSLTAALAVLVAALSVAAQAQGTGTTTIVGVQTRTPAFTTQRPMWTPPGLNDYLAGRKRFAERSFRTPPFVLQRPMWQPPGMRGFLEGNSQFLTPEEAGFGQGPGFGGGASLGFGGFSSRTWAPPIIGPPVRQLPDGTWIFLPDLPYFGFPYPAQGVDGFGGPPPRLRHGFRVR